MTEALLSSLKKLDASSYVVTTTIHQETHVFSYHFNAPTYKMPLTASMGGVYTIPQYGDLLLHVDIQGTFTFAYMYQWDATGRFKIIYDALASEINHQTHTLCPFPESGIPLWNMQKPMYVCVEPKATAVKLVVSYGFVKSSERLYMATYPFPLRLRHKNGSIYRLQQTTPTLNYLEVDIDASRQKTGTRNPPQEEVVGMERERCPICPSMSSSSGTTFVCGQGHVWRRCPFCNRITVRSDGQEVVGCDYC